MDLVFLIDSSGSIQFAGPDNWGIILSFVTNVIQQLVLGTQQARIAMVVFSTNAITRFDFEHYQTTSAMVAFVNATPYQGGTTNLNAALQLASTLFADFQRTNAAKMVIVVTDGADTVNTDNTLTAATDLKNHGATILTVGVTNQIDIPRLMSIASSPRHYFNVSDFSQLNTLLSQIIPSICPTTTAAPSTTTPPPGRLTLFIL